MSTPAADRLRAAAAADASQMLLLWALGFNEDDAARGRRASNTHTSGSRLVEDQSTARFPVIEVDGDVVATAIGTVAVGVPDLQCR